jgi:hypothetical protein
MLKAQSVKQWCEDILFHVKRLNKMTTIKLRLKENKYNQPLEAVPRGTASNLPFKLYALRLKYIKGIFADVFKI